MKIFSKFQQNWWFFQFCWNFEKKSSFFAMKKTLFFANFFFKILKFFKTNSKFWKNLHFLPKFWKNNHLAMLFIVATLLWQYMTVLFKCRLVLFSVVLEGLVDSCLAKLLGFYIPIRKLPLYFAQLLFFCCLLTYLKFASAYPVQIF